MLIFISIFAQAQETIICIKGEKNEVRIYEKYFSNFLKVKNEVDAISSVQNNINQLRKVGYLAAALDTQFITKDSLQAFIYCGKKYEWGTISFENIPTVLASNILLDVKQLKGKVIQPEQIATICEKILKYTENNGYPFASVFLDSITEEQNGIQAKLCVQKNYLITIDSIDVQGDVEISDNFLFHQIGIEPGDVYNEAAMKLISKKINELPFASEAKPWRMSFNVSKSILTLYLQTKSANKADVLVGLLPSNNALGGKFLLTGDVKLALINALNIGEQFMLNWQNLQYKSPRLTVETTLPFLLGSAFGATAKFNYVKNDSTFRTVAGELGATYNTNNFNKIKLYYQINNAAMLTVNTAAILQSLQLPATIDYTNNALGIDAIWNKTNNTLAPTKGWSFQINGNAGIRKLIINNAIEKLKEPITQRSLRYLYDTAGVTSYKYSSHAAIQYYVPLKKRITTKISYLTGIVYNKKLFKNELYQIGGYRLLRGFDEASLFTNQYHVTTIEPRFLLSNTSYVFAFADIAKLQLGNQFNTRNWKTGAGVGAGLSLETRSGLFTVLYAIGNNLSNTFVVKNSKIHFGYVNSF